MTSQQPTLLEHAPEQQPLIDEVLDGLLSDEKSLPAKLHYDERGSELFERICELDEYYITRTELQIMRDNADEIAGVLGQRCMVIEPGSGASLKTRTLLRALDEPAAYVPVEISREFLIEVAHSIAKDHDELEVLPVWADFTRAHPLPEPEADVESRAVYFPGSTIGNFTRDQARSLLERFAEHAGDDGSVVVGFDLAKEVDRMEAAYNDSEGVTAEFNYNVLDRLNDELDAGLDRDRFQFHAEWDSGEGAIVSYLTCEEKTVATIGDRDVHFAKGERVRMEESHKYTRDEFRAIAKDAGLCEHRAWTDPDDDFAVVRLVPGSAANE